MNSNWKTHWIIFTTREYLKLGNHVPGNLRHLDFGSPSCWKEINNFTIGSILGDLPNFGWLDSSILKVSFYKINFLDNWKIVVLYLTDTFNFQFIKFSMRNLLRILDRNETRSYKSPQRMGAGQRDASQWSNSTVAWGHQTTTGCEFHVRDNFRKRPKLYILS